MSGSWANERMGEVEEILEAFKTKVSLRDIVVDDDTKKYLTKSKVEIGKLNHLECVEAALLLNEFATFIQIQINREQGRVTWASECVTRLIASRLDNYGDTYTPKDYKRQLAIADNEAAVSIEQIRINSQLCLDTLSYVPTQIRAVANSYLELSNAKRYKENI